VNIIDRCGWYYWGVPLLGGSYFDRMYREIERFAGERGVEVVFNDRLDHNPGP